MFYLYIIMLCFDCISRRLIPIIFHGGGIIVRDSLRIRTIIVIKARCAPSWGRLGHNETAIDEIHLVHPFGTPVSTRRRRTVQREKKKKKTKNLRLFSTNNWSTQI